ncbi:uncharacterized protein LOC132045449 isoform X2 [Lycium ferocissimum]|uniref:uncharacterized protein LOC132045449 isoform X2 n=1 Tax=Lycium ferocissimum TaxID=112874 RepID=UPI002815ABC3|nr:uncharacterized protein LOC132045449 isoform X2 [Lycium ferocissimum]
MFYTSLIKYCPNTEEEHAISQGNDANEIQASTVKEIQRGEQRGNHSELPAEAAEGDDNLKDANIKEQQSGPWRSYQNQNYRGNRNGSGGGGRRGYSDSRGGRGRGGSYQKGGRNQYYDQSNNYYQKSYYNNYRGRGGSRGSGGPRIFTKWVQYIKNI